jgi:hypothetical protein
MTDQTGKKAGRAGLVRQGDVLLVPVAAVPEDGSKEEAVGTSQVLAEGEATGHAHVVKGSSRLVEWQRPVRWSRPLRRRYLIVEERAVLSHQEHLPIDLDPGVYEVRRQREYRTQRSVWVAD